MVTQPACWRGERGKREKRQRGGENSKSEKCLKFTLSIINLRINLTYPCSQSD